MDKKQDVDIVIPIYNAYEYTKKCIETVIEHTNIEDNRLILINDKSTDEKILPMLEKIVHQYNGLNIILVNNIENLGFVKSVNIGLSYSKNDVILLNSDTEVTENWLEKLRDVAYSRKFVASVTPLSNNASLASVPNYLEDNELPGYLTLEQYSEIIENCSMNIYPEIPTANGFCMYITRQAIDEVGLFDDVTFDKGYGEENDFSYRCINSGYVNLLCDNTFIYHKGTQSFPKDKESLVLDHLKRLEKKHPVNYSNTDSYVRLYPTKYIQDNIKFATDGKYRRNILIVVHDFRDLSDKILGGTTLHIYDLINNLRKHMNFCVLYSDNEYRKLKVFFENSSSEINLGRVHTYNNVNLYNHEYRNIVKRITEIINIDLIHVHHMLYQYLDIFDIAEEKKIPVIMSLHDYYVACPTIQFINEKNHYCECCTDNDACNKCLQNVFHTEGTVMQKWREEFENALGKCNEIIVPSDSVKKIISKYYKNLNINIIEHGVEKQTKNYEAVNYKEGKNIAFIGGINEFKGLQSVIELKELVNSDKNKNNMKLHVFGGTNKEEMNSSDKNYIYQGRYDREDITKLLKENNIQLVCLLSTWPETYSYTLTEAILSKIPVITFDNMGAITDRVRSFDGGWIIDINSGTEYIFNKINEILENDEEYQSKVSNIEKYIDEVKTTKEMTNEYKIIYEKYFKDKKENTLIDKKLLEQILISSNEIEEYKKQVFDYHQSIMQYRDGMEDLRRRHAAIIDSRRWKMLENNKILDIFRKIFRK